MTTTQARGSATSIIARGRRGIDKYGWRAASQEVVVRGMRPFLAPLAARQLRQQVAATAALEEFTELAFAFRAYGISLRPLQSRWEFSRLLSQVAELRPGVMLEIGTANGGSLLAFARVCAPNAHILSVDLPGGAFGGGYPAWKIPVYKAFAATGQRLDLLRGDSHSEETFERVRTRLNGRRLDFLFIDGDHRYEGVRSDFERYRTLVRPGGLIAFHDIAHPHPDSPPVNDPGDVPRFWTDVESEHETESIIDPYGLGCFGIGLVRA